MHFYRLSFDQVMDMPFTRFVLLQRCSVIIELEQEARALGIAHAGKPGDRIKEITNKLRELDKSRSEKVGRTSPSTMTYVTLNQGVNLEAEPGSILAERERQKAAAERLEAERQKWLAARRAEAGQ
jgi:hypothetical protein